MIFLLIYLVKIIGTSLLKYITHLKDKMEHDKNKSECFDYCSNIAGKSCGRIGCKENKNNF